MMRCKTIIFIVLCFNIQKMVVNQAIPTRQEQANLLLNVQEVFEEVKLLIKEETENTERSLSQDVTAMIKRAEYILGLLEELTLLRLSCDSNSVCMLEFRTRIKQIASEGRQSLKFCDSESISNTVKSSATLRNITNSAIDRGQLLLDDLGDCSRKIGLAVIQCYKNIIATDVIPVKLKLLEAIKGHKEAHNEVIQIRRYASTCIDDTILKYRNLMEKTLKEGFSCK